MPIASGVVIKQQSVASNRLAEELAAEKGVEISGIGPAGIALVFETETMQAMTQLTQHIRSYQGVAHLQMTYCSWEDMTGLK